MPVASLPCPDIRTTGTALSLGSHSSTALAIPFPFTFYGTSYTSVQVSASGGLSFTGTTLSTSNSCLPSTTAPIVATFWEHLHPSSGTYYQVLGTAPNRRLVILWDATNFGGGSSEVDFRAVLHESSNDIDVCYVDTTSGSASYDRGASATAGIQNGSGLTLQFSCNTPTLVEGLMLSYIAP
jgi:hypothetical protein